MGMRWRLSGRWSRLGALLVVGVLIGPAVILAQPAFADHHVTVPSGDGRQFVWPVSSWVGANHLYANGSHHSGSADLSAQYFTPLQPARPGTVVRKIYAGGAWGVRIRHETVDGLTYFTGYGHLAAEPLVNVGDVVAAATVFGYLGRTGNANLGGPHVHFTIFRQVGDGPLEEIKIPDLTVGTWVKSGEYIPGVYDALSPIVTERPRPYDVRVSQAGGLGMYATPSRAGADLIGSLSVGTVVTVLDSSRGQYQISVGGQMGWIPHSGTVPVASTVFGVRTNPDYTSVALRRSPGGELVGSLSGGVYLTGFETSSSGWFRVLWGCNHNTNRSTDPADDASDTGGCPSREAGEPSYFKYGWIGPAVANRTSTFQTRTRIDGLNVYGSKTVDGASYPDSGNRIGELGSISSLVTVVGTRNGWYRINFASGTGWIRGWFTSGRQ